MDTKHLTTATIAAMLSVVVVVVVVGGAGCSVVATPTHAATHAAPQSPMSKPDAPTPRVDARAQATPFDGWARWHVDRDGRQGLDVYVAGDTTARKDVLLILQGSKCRPLFSQRQDGSWSSPLLVTDPVFFRERAVIGLAVERRGIQSFEPIPADVAKLDPRVRCRDDWGGIDKPTRIEDVTDAVRALRREPWFGDLLVVGHSEGVDVATGAARALGDEGIRGLGLLAGAGPTQFFDEIAVRRSAGDIEGVAEAFTDLVWLTSTEAEGKYGGYPLRRWKSFAVESTPLEDVTESRVPLFVVNGTEDGKAPPWGADLFVAEVLRRQTARAVLYGNLPGLDHDFVDAGGTDHSKFVLEKFLDWTRRQAPRRGFVIWKEPSGG